MLRTRLLSLVAWTIFVFIGIPASLYAEETGWYAGAGFGASYTDVKESFWMDDSVTSPDSDNWGPSFQAYSGYRLHRHFALEGGYLQIGDSIFTGISSGENTIWSEGSVKGRIKIDGILLQGVGLWPVGDSNLVFYLKGGLFMWDSITRYGSTINAINRFIDDGSTVVGGIGTEVRVWGDWRLRGELEYTAINLANRQNVPVGFFAIGLMHPLH